MVLKRIFKIRFFNIWWRNPSFKTGGRHHRDLSTSSENLHDELRVKRREFTMGANGPIFFQHMTTLEQKKKKRGKTINKNLKKAEIDCNDLPA